MGFGKLIKQMLGRKVNYNRGMNPLPEHLRLQMGPIMRKIPSAQVQPAPTPKTGLGRMAYRVAQPMISHAKAEQRAVKEAAPLIGHEVGEVMGGPAGAAIGQRVAKAVEPQVLEEMQSDDAYIPPTPWRTKPETYARGGIMKNTAPPRYRLKVPSLKQMAAKVRAKGQRRDSVLAHISPNEARLLQSRYGKDVNPHTGLPQYGLLNKIFGKKKRDEHGNVVGRTGLRALVHKMGLHKLEKGVRPIVKMAAPVVGSIVGTMFGGPAGAVIGGSLGGALSSKRHPLDHALGGAFVGLGHSIISPYVAKGLNLNPDSGLAKMLGMNNQTWTEQIPALGGLGKLFGGGGGGGAAAPAAEAATGGGGGLGGLGLRDALDIGLGVTALVAGSKAKSKIPPETETEQQVLDRIRTQRPEDRYRPPAPWNRKQLPPPEGYDYESGIPWKHYEEEVLPEGYAQGGSVKGEYIDGSYGGQKDNIYTDIPAGSYVWDATTLSLLGDGNSENGNEKVDDLEERFMKTGIHRVHPPQKKVKAAISTGERVSPPWFVSAVGKGDTKKGSKELDKMRRNLRKQKGVTKFLPPKSKDVMSYFKG